MDMLRIKLIFSLSFFALLSTAQNKSFHQWVIAQDNEINFNGPTPVNTRINGFSGDEGGCATISDSITGNRLFFSFGGAIFNRNNSAMPNGNNLNGGESGSQPVVIVPSPQRNGKYYVFTTKGYAFNNGLYYSVVDMNLDNGNGDIASGQKNIPVVSTPVVEKLTAVMMCNNRDFYIISHELGSNRFIFVPVTSTGVGSPIFISSGSVIPNNANASRGVIKVSPDKQRLVCVQNLPTNNIVEVFNINHGSTPTLSNPISLFTFGGEFGASFSTDNSKLYTSTSKDTTISGNSAVKNQIIQYDLTAGNLRTGRVLFSKIDNLPFSVPGYFWFGDMNIAPNGKIYMTFGHNAYLIGLSNINAQVSQVAIDSNLRVGSTVRAGIPNVLTHLYNQPLQAKFTSNIVCFNFPMAFSNTSYTNYTNSLWNFGDPGSGANNISNAQNPTHTYINPGKYRVTLTVSNSCSESATFSDSIEVFRALPLELGNDTSICTGNSVTFDTKIGGASYQWFLLPDNTNPIGSSQTISVNRSGTYLVNVNTSSCNGTDSIKLQVDVIKPRVTFPDTSYFCADSTLFLDATNNGSNLNAKYAWSNGATTGKLAPTAAQKYIVKVNIGACSATDSTVVFQDSLPKIRVADQSACPGDPVPFRIDPNPGIAGVLWSNGVTGYAAVYSDSGNHRVTISSKTGCVQRDTFYLRGKCKPFFVMPTAFTPNDDGFNDTMKIISSGVSELQFEVYTRQNQIVFSTTDPTIGWDGNYKGKACMTGRYFWRAYYKIDVSDPKSIIDRPQFQTKTGVITLLR
jgi:gliding motility-associated-like protein